MTGNPKIQALHEGEVTMRSYSYAREETEHYIEMLANKYPKCFFVDPSLRRPLKKDIEQDLENDGTIPNATLRRHVLDWYMNHFKYRYAIVAGVQRVDLNGNNAGAVTETEQREAREWIFARKRELIAMKQPRKAPANGRVQGAGL
jgi:ProP effector